MTDGVCCKVKLEGYNNGVTSTVTSDIQTETWDEILTVVMDNFLPSMGYIITPDTRNSFSEWLESTTRQHLRDMCEVDYDKEFYGE